MPMISTFTHHRINATSDKEQASEVVPACELIADAGVNLPFDCANEMRMATVMALFDRRVTTDQEPIEKRAAEATG